MTAPRQCDRTTVAPSSDLGSRPGWCPGPTTAPAATDVVPAQLGAGLAGRRPRPTAHGDVDPGGLRVDDGDAGAHQVVEHAVVEGAAALGELAAVVAAEDVVGVVGADAAGRGPVGDQRRERVGQVLLALGVVGAEPGQAPGAGRPASAT